MPEQIPVSDFLREAWEDFKSPTTSTFVGRMPHCKSTVSSLEETLDTDRSGLTKMKKSIKALQSTGNTHVSNQMYLAGHLEKLGNNAMNRDQEAELGAAFLKFAVVTKELSALMRNLMQNLMNIVMFPMESFLKGDLRGVKGDLKKPFDKAWKDYDSKFNKLEKEKKQIAKEAGMIRTEVTGAEIAEEMEKERRMFQLQMCEYLIKVNEIKTKKGVDLLQHFVEYYQAQNNFFQDGLKTIEHFRCYIEELVGQLNKIKQRQDLEKKQLMELRDALKSTVSAYKETPSASSAIYNLHQLQGNKAHGYEKTGFLLKKSEGKMRKVWQRRKCWIKDGFLFITHSDITKEPVKLNLLTCQVKLVPDDPGKKCFDLISSSKNRTYHFQAEDHPEMEEWMSVLSNAKEAVLLKAFGEPGGAETSPIQQSVKELTHSIIQEVRRLPGNSNCCDCGAESPEWLSVNLGVLVCLECCGVHREMGVHISRTQSIVIDRVGTAQLLLARVVSNRGFNEIMEATLDLKIKPTPLSAMDDRKNFIRAKYEKKCFAIVTCTSLEDRRQDLKQAIQTKDIFALLQVYAEGIDFMQPLPDMENNESALHLAILQEDGTSLPLVDFILQNSNCQDLLRRTNEGNNALHLCAKYNQTDCMKLLLRVQPDLVNYENGMGQTALEIARDSGHDVCVDLINHALEGKTELFENVNIDWDLIQDDHLFDNVDYSDDDLDSVSTPDRKTRSRPGSLVVPPDISSLTTGHSRERSLTVDSIKCYTLPPPNKSKGATLTHNANSSANSNVSGTGTLPKKKPAPPPPQNSQGHIRNPSDPGQSLPRGHIRTPSDPPPLPAKLGIPNHPRTNLPVGAKLVLPPPPQFSAAGPHGHKGGNKPVPAPRPAKLLSAGAFEGNNNNRVSGERPRSTSLTNSNTSSLQSLSRSDERLDSTDSSGSDRQPPPVPNPRAKRKLSLQAVRRCRALYDCSADNEDELSFHEGEIILVLKEEEEEWWEGQIEGQPERRGMFPATFVHILSD